eukprot:m.360072 g.360072  ORF g.360072 m.360072 type:complete len:368 (+) comp18865_c0_seq1:30-1133(+)
MAFHDSTHRARLFADQALMQESKEAVYAKARKAILANMQFRMETNRITEAEVLTLAEEQVMIHYLCRLIYPIFFALGNPQRRPIRSDMAYTACSYLKQVYTSNSVLDNLPTLALRCAVLVASKCLAPVLKHIPLDLIAEELNAKTLTKFMARVEGKSTSMTPEVVQQVVASVATAVPTDELVSYEPRFCDKLDFKLTVHDPESCLLGFLADIQAQQSTALAATEADSTAEDRALVDWAKVTQAAKHTLWRWWCTDAQLVYTPSLLALSAMAKHIPQAVFEEYIDYLSDRTHSEDEDDKGEALILRCTELIEAVEQELDSVSRTDDELQIIFSKWQRSRDPFKDFTSEEYADLKERKRQAKRAKKGGK